MVPVYAAGERDGAAYLVMRFIDGDDLRTLVLRDGPLAPGRAADMIGRVAAGLDVIHRAGYVHRDVKPANVLVDRDGHVYVTDFGLAKQVLSRGGATATGHWVGTLDYVAPEQVRGGAVDARADVYALGGVLCFMLTGHVPFERDGDEAKLWAQLSAPPPEPSQLRPGIPRAFDASSRARWPRSRTRATRRRATSVARRWRRPRASRRSSRSGWWRVAPRRPGGDPTELDRRGVDAHRGRPAAEAAAPPRSLRRRLLPVRWPGSSRRRRSSPSCSRATRRSPDRRDDPGRRDHPRRR